jgi:hypothetical protein
MKTRIVHTRFWKDNYISGVNRLTRYLYLYLLTNENVNMCGMYELPDRYIKADLDMSQAELDSSKVELSKAGKVLFYEGWVKIVNIDKYNSYTGESNLKAREKELALVPAILLGLDPSVNPSVEGGYTPTSNKKPETSNKNTEIGESERKETVEEMKELWKSVAGTVLRNHEEENLKAYQYLKKEVGETLPSLLQAVRMIRADKYQKRTLQAKLINYVGLREKLEEVEAYMAGHMDTKTIQTNKLISIPGRRTL